MVYDAVDVGGLWYDDVVTADYHRNEVMKARRFDIIR